MNDIWHVIILQLELHDLKNLIINKQFNNILNNEYFWCQWLKKYDIDTSKNCKYIATHIDTNLLYEFNFRNAIKNSYIPVIKYYLDHLVQYEDIDVDYLYFRLIRDNNTYLLNQLSSYQLHDIDHVLCALAYKKYDILKILLDYTQLLPLDLKIKIISLVNKNLKDFSDESIVIENENDNLFKPYITKNNYAAWRGDFLY
jgi:hypothetical protein